MKAYEIIKNKLGDRVFTDFPAKDITSYKTGGAIDLLVYPKSKDELVFIFDVIKKENLNYFISGNATNILVSDKGFRGIFIKTDLFKKIIIKENRIIAECGVLWDKMIEISVLNGLCGLEKTSYIPGSVGGTIRMNAGAFGQETFDRLEKFNVVDLKTMELKEIFKSNIKYGYRYVEGIENYFILSGEFVFEKKDPKELKNIRDEIIKKRIEKQPLEYPSAGSVFKRPPNDYASRLIEECGLKGIKVGGAMVSEKHAGFIINTGNATSCDIYKLINLVREKVYQKTGILLELEQILVGEF
jgi:UDP-N-acetylmuramate dehydrogenase